MTQTHFLQTLYKTYISKKCSDEAKDSTILKTIENLSTNEKKDLGLQLLQKGELLLLKNNFTESLEYFQKAEQLDSANPNIWHRIGLAFFEYGSKKNNKKAYLLANKKFNVATNLEPTNFIF